MAGNTPLINGVLYSWSSIKTNIMGVPVTGITKIMYREKQAIEAGLGAGSKPVGVSYGEVEFEGSISLYANEIEQLQELSPTGRLQDLPPFEIVVAYIAGGKVKTHRLQYVIFTANGREADTGTKGITEDIPLFIGDIKWK